MRKHTDEKVLTEVVGTLRLISTGPDPRLRYRADLEIIQIDRR